MPMLNAQGAFSLGRDAQIVVIHPLAPGGRLDIPNVTSVSVTPQYDQVRSKQLSGVMAQADLPAGHTGTIELDRAGPQIDDLQVLVEAAWRSGGRIYSATVFVYINEPDGSVSTYQYSDCSISFPAVGNYQADQVVKQTISFMANRKLKV